MTALAADKPRTFASTPLEHRERLPVIAGAKVYAGSVCMWDDAGSPTLGIEAHAGAVTKVFAGFATELVDNTGGALGDKLAEVVRTGIVELTTNDTIAAADVNDPIYATADDDTFTQTSTNNTPIGKITRVVIAGAAGVNRIEVKFEAAGFTSI